MELALRASREAAIAIVLLVACSQAVSAHRRDEYLEAARIAVAPERVEVGLDLTPGIAVAARVIADIDRDRDGTASTTEQQAYARRVLSAVSVSVDGVPLAADIHALAFPSFESIRRGEGAMRLRMTASLPSLSAGAHHLVFRNNHEPDVSVYLANALVPETDRVAITSQRRDAAQHELTISFQLHGSSSAAVWALGGLVAIAILTALMRASTAGRRRVDTGPVTVDADTATTLPAPPRAQWSR